MTDRAACARALCDFYGRSERLWRLEYLHYDFGKVQDAATFTSTVPGDLPFSERRGRQTIEVLRDGISCKFTPDQPLVARY